MEFKKFKDRYLVRLEKGEDIVQSLLSLAKSENIRLASINGLGAVSYAEIGLYKLDEKKYYSNTYEGDFEIANLHGNLSTMDGEEYIHLHIIVADGDQRCFGGHLNKGIISATGEIFVDVLDGEVDRFKGENGINLLDLK
ncbi:PPC domain-containing DNA-binding protein [Neofamilia massiliensis]|uniref:PPC domain-containing DNA-binding protein n=1 Tax=Neofamilia massiliensis TaxID=1673724 RepID=UPI0006BB63A5|nr:PPC domain-containing DNA-binding protein [Neofamilia massiliensis]